MRIGPRKLIALLVLAVVAAALVMLVVTEVVDAGPALTIAAVAFVALLVAFADVRQARRQARTEQRLAARIDRVRNGVQQDLQQLQRRVDKIPTALPPMPKPTVVMDKLPGLLEQTLRDMEGRQTRALQARTERIELAIDQQRAQLESQLEDAEKTLAKQVQCTRGLVQTVRRERQHDRRYLPRLTQATIALTRELDGKAALPMGTVWAASSDLLLFLYHLTGAMQPAKVLECGSGVSSSVVALALPEDSKVTTLEDNVAFAARTRKWAADLGVADKVEVVDAPLRDVELDGETFPWYSLDGLGDLTGVQLLVVDGPWGGLRERARQPALPMLRDRLADDVVVIIDDANRDDETAIVESWRQLLPDHQLQHVDHQKGTAILAPSGSVALTME